MINILTHTGPMIIYRMVIIEGRCDKLQLLISYIYDHWLTQKYSEFWLVRYNGLVWSNIAVPFFYHPIYMIIEYQSLYSQIDNQIALSCWMMMALLQLNRWLIVGITNDSTDGWLLVYTCVSPPSHHLLAIILSQQHLISQVTELA